jgi:hypothetical protein
VLVKRGVFLHRCLIFWDFAGSRNAKEGVLQLEMTTLLQSLPAEVSSLKKTIRRDLICSFISPQIQQPHHFVQTRARCLVHIDIAGYFTLEIGFFQYNPQYSMGDTTSKVFTFRSTPIK